MGDTLFYQDPTMDSMLADIIDIFHLDGVELVRLSGITKRARRISGHDDMPEHVVDAIIKKLKGAEMLNYKYTLKCPYCGEVSYVITHNESQPIGTKLCDSCNTMYQPLLGASLIKD